MKDDAEIDAELEARCALHEAECKALAEGARRSRVANWVCLALLAACIAGALHELGFLRWPR